MKYLLMKKHIQKYQCTLQFILPNIQIVLLQLLEMKIHELKSFATRRRQFSNLNEWNLCKT